MRDYPSRPKFFCVKFCRLLWKACAANELGGDVCWLLAGIAMTEDARGYRGPVTYFNQQLASVCGYSSVDAMARARDKAIKLGWLKYTPGAKGIAGKYFVTVPATVEGWDDNPTDENIKEEYYPKNAEETATQARTKREESETQARGKPEESADHSYLSLNLNLKEEPPLSPVGGNTRKKSKTVDHWSPEQMPLPHTDPAFVEAWTDFVEHRRAKRSPVTNKAAKAIFQKFRNNNLTLSQATECLMDSVANGHLGVFPEKVKTKTAPQQFKSSAEREREYSAKMAQNIFDRIPPEKLAEIAREEAEEKARQEARKLPTYRQTPQALPAAKPRKDPPPGFQYPGNWDTMQNYEQDMWLIDNGFSPVQRVKGYA